MFSPEGKLVATMHWISRFLYLQILWFFFSIVGLVIGGIFPATFTLFGISRKWLRDHEDIPLYSTFWSMYKESFVKANVLGWGMALFAYSIYFYYNWFVELPGMLPTVGIGVLLILGFAFIIVALFIIPVFVHFDVSILNVVKHAGVTAISYPFLAVAMMIAIVIHWYFFVYFPIVFLFFGVSTLAFILMFIANIAFLSIERKLAE